MKTTGARIYGRSGHWGSRRMVNGIEDNSSDRSKIENDLAARSSVEDRAAAPKSARDEQEFLITNQAMALKQGSLSASQVCLQGVFALAAECLAGSDPESKRKAERALNDHLLLSLLDDMRERLQELDDAIAESRQKLIVKYGNDYVGGMADTLLTDTEQAGLKTDDEKLGALADKVLNADGAIKDRYKALEEAAYVRDWFEAQKLRPIVAKYEGRNYLTAEEGMELYETAQNSSLAENKNMIAISSNETLRSTADKALESDRGEVNEAKATTTVLFGQ